MRLFYVPTWGAHGLRRQAGPLDKDSKDTVDRLAKEGTIDKDSGKKQLRQEEIGLEAAEESARRRLEEVKARRAKKGSSSKEDAKDKKDDKPEKDDQKTRPPPRRAQPPRRRQATEPGSASEDRAEYHVIDESADVAMPDRSRVVLGRWKKLILLAREREEQARDA